MPSNSRKNKKSAGRRNAGLWPLVGLNRTIVLAIIVLASTLGAWYVTGSNAASAELRSGITASGGPYCLDDKSDLGTGNEVDAWPCNGTAAQHFSFSAGLIHIGAGCAVEQDASSSSGFHAIRNVVIGPCSNPAPWGGLWTQVGNEFHNNHATGTSSPYCLNVSGGQPKAQVLVYPCGSGASNENWYPDTFTTSSSGGGGSSGSGISSIVNIAEQFAGKEHETPDGCNCGGAVIDGANIDTFTQHNPGELWCADFASWVYWKAGYGLASRGAYQRTASVSGIAAWFQAHGKWYANTAANRSAHPPEPGDFMDFNSGGHGGVVKGVSGNTLTDIEGNYANGVYNVAYSMSGGINDHSNDATGWGRF